MTFHGTISEGIKKMKHINSRLFTALSILLFLFGMFYLFPLPQDAELLKIYKQKDADVSLLFSPQVKVVQELNTCYLSYVQSGFSSRLSRSGFQLEVLDRDTRAKRYYLVQCPSDELPILSAYGIVRRIEQDIVLFWSEYGEAREILPAQFHLVCLPDEPLYSLQRKFLESGEVFPPAARLPARLKTHPVIVEIVSKVSRQNLTDRIQSLQDFQTRYASTQNCELSGTFIHDSFIQSGIQAGYNAFFFTGNNTSRNIVGTLQGAVDPAQVVVICAHYDSYSNQPDTLAPGADDNASGTAAVLEAARIFAGYSFDFSVKFICFSAEEWGLYGSKDYASKARQQGEEIIAVINLDMIAFTDILPEDLDVISNPDSEWLADRFFSVTPLYAPLDIFKIVNSSFVWSDHSPFWNNGYSAILGIEDYNVPNPYYHTTHDTIDTLNFDFITDVMKASLATVADLAQPVSAPLTPTGFASRSQIVNSLFTSRKSVYLTWYSNQDPVTGYNLYRTTTSHSGYQKVNSTPLTQTYYLDRNLDPDTTYYYVVTAVDNQGRESNYSREVTDSGENSSAPVRREGPAFRNSTRTLSPRR